MLSSYYIRYSGISTAVWGSVLFFAAVLLMQDVAAMPGFARQVGAECQSCHFQHHPKLNAYGRAFKASGYSQSSEALIEGDNLSLSPQLSIGFFFKTRGVGTDSTEMQWQVPDEAALLIGGRLAEGMGGLAEVSDEILSYKISLTHALASGPTVGATVFTTDGLGPAYGFELMSTGVLRNSRPFERSARPTTSGPVDLSGGTTGIALHAAEPSWFTALTLYLPDDRITGATDRDTGSNLATYLRAAWMPNIGDWDAGFGFGVLAGSAEATDATTNIRTIYESDAWLMDAQMQGQVAGRDLGLYLVYGQGDDTVDTADTVHVYNGGYAKAPTAWGLDAEYSVTKRLSLLASVGEQDNGHPTQTAKRIASGGLYWKFTQNVTLQAMYEAFNGDQASDNYRNTLQLETGF